MKTTAVKIFVSDKLGSVSGEVIEPEQTKVMMTLAHGAGAGMNHPFLKKLAIDLAQYGIATLRFNLHYMEHGKKRPDLPHVAHEVILGAIQYGQENFGTIPLVCAGKSFGGRMSSQLMAKKLPETKQVRGLVFYGFPLHPANAPSEDRAHHLADVEVPMLFLQGTKDALAEFSLINTVVKRLPLASMDVVEGADHSFKVGKKEAIVDLSRKTENWLIRENILHA